MSGGTQGSDQRSEKHIGRDVGDREDQSGVGNLNMTGGAAMRVAGRVGMRVLDVAARGVGRSAMRDMIARRSGVQRRVMPVLGKLGDRRDKARRRQKHGGKERDHSAQGGHLNSHRLTV